MLHYIKNNFHNGNFKKSVHVGSIALRTRLLHELTERYRTGSTGYIGGSVFEKIIQTYPDLKITALVRSPSDEFKSRYPNVKIVLGDFDSYDVIETAASKADIVIRQHPFFRSWLPITDLAFNRYWRY